jgi:hypothetical protein
MSASTDRHAEDRERRRRKSRYGMQVRGRSVRLLARLAASATPKKVKKRRKKARQRAGKKPGRG